MKVCINYYQQIPLIRKRRQDFTSEKLNRYLDVSKQISEGGVIYMDFPKLNQLV